MRCLRWLRSCELLLGRLGTQPDPRVGIPRIGRRVRGDLACNVELRFEEPGRLPREVVQAVLRALEDVERGEDCVRQVTTESVRSLFKQ